MNQPRYLPVLYDYLNSLNAQENERDTRLNGVIHCSELSWCLRCAYYCMLRKPKVHCTPPDKRLTFDQGHAVHAMLQRYNADNPNIITHPEVEVSDPELNLYGHSDEIWILPGEPDCGIEFKTCKTEKFDRPPLSGSVGGHNAPMDGHIMQVHCYMHCTGIKQWIVVYFNKNNSRLKEFYVPWDDAVWAKALERINTINRAVAEEVPPEGFVTMWCSECVYFHLCDAPGVDEWRKK